MNLCMFLSRALLEQMLDVPLAFSDGQGSRVCHAIFVVDYVIEDQIL